MVVTGIARTKNLLKKHLLPFLHASQLSRVPPLPIRLQARRRSRACAGHEHDQQHERCCACAQASAGYASGHASDARQAHHVRDGQQSQHQDARDPWQRKQGHDQPGSQGNYISRNWQPGFDMITAAYLYGVKTASHAHDRMEERTPFDRSKVDKLQKAVDMAKLKPGVYYIPLRSANGEIRGYAQFKGVQGRNTPVLATVLSAFMTPSGVSIETKLQLPGGRS